MNARDLLETWALLLEAEQKRVSGTAIDQPITQVIGRLVYTIGTLHLYELTLPQGSSIEQDTPLSIIPPDGMEPTEGITLGGQGNVALVQTSMPSDSPVPMRRWFPIGPGFWPRQPNACVTCLRSPTPIDSAQQTAWFPSSRRRREQENFRVSHRIVDPHDRLGGRAFDATAAISWLAIELIRANKRILMVCPDHQAADALVGTIARAMKAVGLMYKTWVSRYEMALAQQIEGIGIQELGFEAQMHQFYAKSRADKAALRRKYDRFRELTPVLSYKGQKQKDLDEVRLLEWRLLTQVSDLQAKIKDVNATSRRI